MQSQDDYSRQSLHVKWYLRVYILIDGCFKWNAKAYAIFIRTHSNKLHTAECSQL